MPRRFAFLLSAIFALIPISAAEPRPFDSIDHYETRQIQGWKVLVNKSLIGSKSDLSKQTLTHLDHQLYQITRKLPADAVSELRKVLIWVEENERHHPCMAYHPDAGWLNEHDMNPAKAKCVEIANAGNFLSWTKEQPWMVLHELAHAYHHQFLEGGFKNPAVADAFENAKQTKRYEKVLHYDGKTVPAYAATNPMEYFAESTEAFFGANDFYPFVRAELTRHDPEMERIVGTLWGAKK